MAVSGGTPTEKSKKKHLHSHDLIVVEKPLSNSLKILTEKLSVSGSYTENYIDNSIMRFGEICDHDDGYLCEHRLQFIVNYINKNF